MDEQLRQEIIKQICNQKITRVCFSMKEFGTSWCDIEEAIQDPIEWMEGMLNRSNNLHPDMYIDPTKVQVTQTSFEDGEFKIFARLRKD